MINWTPRRRAAVHLILMTHPAHANLCQIAAKKVWPHARKQDQVGAQRWQLWPDPDEALYIVPKDVDNPLSWDWHVVVEAEEHCVDALTGPDGYKAGAQARQYIARYFHDPHTITAEPWRGEALITNSTGRRR